MSLGLLSKLSPQRTCLFSLVASDSVSEQLPSQQGPVPSHPPCQHTHTCTNTHAFTVRATAQKDYGAFGGTHARQRHPGKSRSPP